MLRRSILTEEISRRGYHLTREYSSDPLEILFVREVMRTNVVAVPENVQHVGLAHRISNKHHRGQILYPVVDKDLRLTGVITGHHLKEFLDSGGRAGQDGNATLRAVVYRMAETGKTRLPVVDPADSRRLLGMISLNDLLHARVRALDEERKRERVLRIRLPGPKA
jgi:CIC family chloride channel protein